MSGFIPLIHTRLLTAAAFFIVALVLPASLAAQTDAGALRVLVTDQTEAVVPGATIEVTNVAIGFTLSGVSDMGGYGQFAPLPRGIYSVRVSLASFQTTEVSNVRSEVNERRFVPVIRGWPQPMRWSKSCPARQSFKARRVRSVK